MVISLEGVCLATCVEARQCTKDHPPALDALCQEVARPVKSNLRFCTCSFAAGQVDADRFMAVRQYWSSAILTATTRCSWLERGPSEEPALIHICHVQYMVDQKRPRCIRLERWEHLAQ